MPDYRDRLRERLAAEGVTPSAHREAIDEIAAHLNDLHRCGAARGQGPAEAEAAIEAELARMGSLAVAVAERAKRKRPRLAGRERWTSGIAADLRHAIRVLHREREFLRRSSS